MKDREERSAALLPACPSSSQRHPSRPRCRGAGALQEEPWGGQGRRNEDKGGEVRRREEKGGERDEKVRSRAAPPEKRAPQSPARQKPARVQPKHN
ncbi:unnamed protein product [Arctogadus glacialis]